MPTAEREAVTLLEAIKAAVEAQVVNRVITISFDSALSATTVVNVPGLPQAARLAAVRINVKTAITANDTNYWTFALANKGTDGTGTAALLAATDANTTKATGGAGIAAYTNRALTLGAAADLDIEAGSVLEFSATKASSAANLVQCSIQLEFQALPVAS
jgi:hypothetical protein